MGGQELESRGPDEPHRLSIGHCPRREGLEGRARPPPWRHVRRGRRPGRRGARPPYRPRRGRTRRSRRASRWTGRKSGPTTFQWACLPCRARSRRLPPGWPGDRLPRISSWGGPPGSGERSSIRPCRSTPGSPGSSPTLRAEGPEPGPRRHLRRSPRVARGPPPPRAPSPTAAPLTASAGRQPNSSTRRGEGGDARHGDGGHDRVDEELTGVHERCQARRRRRRTRRWPGRAGAAGPAPCAGRRG